MDPILIIISLVLAGIIFLLIEFLLTPGVGIAGIVGLGSLIGSCLYSFLAVDTRTGTITTAAVGLLVILTLVWMLRAKTWKKLELKEEIDVKVNRESEQVKTGYNGTALTRLAPMGTVRFASITCEAKSFDNTMIDPGTEVTVVAIEDNRIIVKPTNK